MAKKRFAEVIISFYDDFLKTTADILYSLADMQEKYKEYEQLKEIQRDPSKIYEELNRRLTDRERQILLDMFITISKFESKLRIMYDLKPKEQRQLAEDLKTFVSKFRELMEKEIEHGRRKNVIRHTKRR